MAQTQTRRPAEEEGLAPRTAWMIGGVAVFVVAAMFYVLWRGQYAAPPRYLFDTPSQGVEAGYCLAVAQDVVPSGAPIGSYFDEAAQFWIKRMRVLNAPMGASIASGRARLSADISRSGMGADDWLQNAMEICSNRALMYGVRFRAFE